MSARLCGRFTIIYHDILHGHAPDSSFVHTGPCPTDTRTTASIGKISPRDTHERMDLKAHRPGMVNMRQRSSASSSSVRSEIPYSKHPKPDSLRTSFRPSVTRTAVFSLLSSSLLSCTIFCSLSPARHDDSTPSRHHAHCASCGSDDHHDIPKRYCRADCHDPSFFSPYCLDRWRVRRWNCTCSGSCDRLDMVGQMHRAR